MSLPPGGLSCIICKMGHRELHKEGTRKCLECTIGFALRRNRILCAQERVAIFHFMPSFNQHLTSTPPLLSIQLSAERGRNKHPRTPDLPHWENTSCISSRCCASHRQLRRSFLRQRCVPVLSLPMHFMGSQNHVSQQTGLDTSLDWVSSGDLWLCLRFSCSRVWVKAGFVCSEASFQNNKHYL